MVLLTYIVNVKYIIEYWFFFSIMYSLLYYTENASQKPFTGHWIWMKF